MLLILTIIAYNLSNLDDCMCVSCLICLKLYYYSELKIIINTNHGTIKLSRSNHDLYYTCMPSTIDYV